RRPPRSGAIFVRVWDADRVVAEIRARARQKQPLAVSRVPARLSAAARLYCGSWRAAIEAAGFDYRTIALHKHCDDDELLAQMQQLARRHPRMTLTALHARALGKVLMAHFGSVEAAANAAGLTGWP